MSYYVYGTFVDRERFSFKTKEEALAFSKWADKNINTPCDWLFLSNSDKCDEEQGFWECATRSRASEWKFISKPIKSYSFWNRLKNQFWFILHINRISEWIDDVPMKP